MPHECTACGRTFADGSKEMLSGCPRCGGHKFRYLPGGHDPDETPVGDIATDDGAAADTTDRSSNGSPGGAAGQSSNPSPAADTAGSSNTPAGDPADGSSGSDDDIVVADEESLADETPEDGAQADARAGVADEDEVDAAVDGSDSRPAADRPTRIRERDSSSDAGGDAADATDRPDLGELREELNDQFESIRIEEPGQYELNLMQLYDREEHIISLREDGRYVIEVPESWREVGEE